MPKLQRRAGAFWVCLLFAGLLLAALAETALASADKEGASKRTVAGAAPLPGAEPSGRRASSFSERLETLRPHKALQVVSRSLSRQDSRCSALINYPQLGNMRIDAELSFWAEQTLETFVSGVDNIRNSADGRYSILVDYELSQASERFLSVVFRIRTDTGGVYPDDGMVTFTYDLVRGSRLEFDDLFGDSAGLIYFFSLYSHDALVKKLGVGAETSVSKGTVPSGSNFSLFVLTQDGLTLFFPPYQVADYAKGEQKVSVPLDKLKPYKPRLEVWGLSAPGRLTSW